MLNLMPAATCWRNTLPPAQADRATLDLSGLGDHLALCRGQSGRLFAMRCLAETTHGLVAPRFVSTMLVIGMLILAAALVV